MFLKSLCLVIPFIALSIIWFPVLKHYYVPNVLITDEMVRKSRSMPMDEVLIEIGGTSESLEEKYRRRTIADAERILKGEFAFEWCSSEKVSIPFHADDLDKGLPGCHLMLASLEIPNILISAYELTGRDDFLFAARDVILEWAAYERKAWLPKGLLWNDHALSARIYVLAKFWKLYRNHNSFKTDAAKDVLQFAARSSQFLSKPSHFTFSTNHGIMQNVALLGVSLAFPNLPNLESYKNIAVERMNDQMSFYINDEGVILEHSAGYQRAGLEFISMALRYLTLLNIKAPDKWIIKYEKAKEMYAQLRRPDGTLPMYGDTDIYIDPLGPRVTGIDDGRVQPLQYQNNWIPGQSVSLYPVAGYSIWWDGLEGWPDERKLNQTVVAWSYFPGQAHKHADEMSVSLYAGGQTWWTNAGYWTYGTGGRTEAISWSGSNAPHLVSEAAESARKTELKYYGWSDLISVIDLERNGSSHYSARRQVIRWKPDLWIVIDSTSGEENSRTKTIWTTAPDVKLQGGKFPDSFYLINDDKHLSLEAFFLTSAKTGFKHYKGSLVPFAGWVQNEPADALVLEQPANNSWSAAIWSLGGMDSSSLNFSKQPYMKHWVSPEAWKIVLPAAAGPISIWRDYDRVYINDGSKTDGVYGVGLKIAPDGTSLKHAEIQNAFGKAADKYPKFRNLTYYLWEVTYLMIAFLILQEIFFFIYKKRKGMHYFRLRIFAMSGWISLVAVWEVIVFLKT